MHRFAVLLIMIALLSVDIVAARGQQALTRKQILESADINKDGRIDRIEFLNRMKDAFFFIDANKDGYVDATEYQRLQVGDPKRLAAADRNKDGKLSIDEFLKITSEDFDAADKNNDGVVDEEEMKAWIAR